MTPDMMSSIIAFFAGMVCGVIVAVPWRPVIRAHVHDVEARALAIRLEAARKRLDSQDHRAWPYVDDGSIQA